MRFPLVNLEDVITFKGGGTPRKDVPAFWDGNIPWASVKDFKTTELSKTTDYITQEGRRTLAPSATPHLAIWCSNGKTIQSPKLV